MVIQKPTTYLSTFSKLIGVESINKVEFSNNEVTYHLNRFFKNVNNQDHSDYKTFKITLQNGITELKFSESNNRIIIDKDKNLKFVSNELLNKHFNPSGRTTENIDFQNPEIINLLILYDQVLNPENEQTEINSFDGETRRMISISAYPTRSVAAAQLAKEVERFIESHPSCTKIGTGDSGCLWGDYICVASQSYDCPKSACN